MSKQTDIEYQKAYQDSFDWLAVSCHAATQAESRYRNLFKKIGERGIAEKHKEGRDESVVNLEDAYFLPTDEERKEMRELYNEWQAHKIIWNEKIEEHNLVQKHGKKLSLYERADISLADSKGKLYTEILKILFYLLVTAASITVVVKLAF